MQIATIASPIIAVLLACYTARCSKADTIKQIDANAKSSKDQIESIKGLCALQMDTTIEMLILEYRRLYNTRCSKTNKIKELNENLNDPFANDKDIDVSKLKSEKNIMMSEIKLLKDLEDRLVDRVEELRKEKEKFMEV